MKVDQRKWRAMLCKHCGRDTKAGFPYCMNCGEWVGRQASSGEHVTGSWGNREFDGGSRPAFLIGGPRESGRDYREPGVMREVPAATLRRSRGPERRVSSTYKSAAQNLTLRWKRA